MEPVRFAGGLRHEMSQLFGLSWDVFLEWVLIALLSGWLWSLILSGGVDSTIPSSGPLTWLASVCGALGVSETWVDATIGWINSPGRSWIANGAIAAASAMATLAARGHQHTGLRVCAFASLTISLEARPAMLTIALFCGITLAPLVVAIAVGVVQSRLDEGRFVGSFNGSVAASRYSGLLMGFLVRPVVAPAVLFIELVRSYEFRRRWDPADEATSIALDELERAPRKLADVDASVALSVLAASVASTSTSQSAHGVSASLWNAMRNRRDARIARVRAESLRRQDSGLLMALTNERRRDEPQST